MREFDALGWRYFCLMEVFLSFFLNPLNEFYVIRIDIMFSIIFCLNLPFYASKSINLFKIVM